MKQRKGGRPSTRHEEVYHAAPRCQAASLSLTARRLHGLKKTCHIEGQKTGCCFASLSSSPGMVLLGSLKRCCLVALVLEPHGMDHPYPHIGESTHGDGVTFPFLPLALIVLQCPWFAERRLPGELLQGIAQRFDATQASMRFLVRPALEEDWRGAGEGLQTAGAFIAGPVVADFSQQTRSETLTGSWQSLEELEVFMRQKKAFDLLVVVSNLLHQGFQLVQERQHQPRFGASCDRVRLQTRLLEVLGDLLGSPLGPRISGLFERGGQLLYRGRAGCLQGWIGAQERQ